MRPDLAEIMRTSEVLGALDPTLPSYKSRIYAVTANYAVAYESGSRLLDGHFVRKQEGGCAVFELHQQHSTPEVVHRTQNARFFVISAQPFMVSHRLEQPTMPPNHR